MTQEVDEQVSSEELGKAVRVLRKHGYEVICDRLLTVQQQEKSVEIAFLDRLIDDPGQETVQRKPPAPVFAAFYLEATADAPLFCRVLYGERVANQVVRSLRRLGLFPVDRRVLGVETDDNHGLGFPRIRPQSLLLNGLYGSHGAWRTRATRALQFGDRVPTRG